MNLKTKIQNKLEKTKKIKQPTFVILVLISIVFFFNPQSVFATAYDDVVLADSPWGYWKLDEASGAPQDSSGNGRHGAIWLGLSGSVTYEQLSLLPAEPAGKSIKFTNAAVQLPALTLNNLDYTLEAWLKVQDIAQYNSLWFCGEFGVAGWTVKALLNTNGSIQIDHYDAGLTTSAGEVDDNDVVHVVFRRQHAADLMSIWVNGQKVAENNNGPQTAASTDFWFGWISNTGLRSYASHVAVYLDDLSDAQILAHYEAGDPPAPAPAIKGKLNFLGGIRFLGGIFFGRF